WRLPLLDAHSTFTGPPLLSVAVGLVYVTTAPVGPSASAGLLGPYGAPALGPGVTSNEGGVTSFTVTSNSTTAAFGAGLARTSVAVHVTPVVPTGNRPLKLKRAPVSLTNVIAVVGDWQITSATATLSVASIAKVTFSKSLLSASTATNVGSGVVSVGSTTATVGGIGS